jgi:hypothetical protein
VPSFSVGLSRTNAGWEPTTVWVPWPSRTATRRAPCALFMGEGHRFRTSVSGPAFQDRRFRTSGAGKAGFVRFLLRRSAYRTTENYQKNQENYPCRPGTDFAMNKYVMMMRQGSQTWIRNKHSR